MLAATGGGDISAATSPAISAAPTGRKPAAGWAVSAADRSIPAPFCVQSPAHKRRMYAAAANLDTQPSFGSMANPAGRQIEKTMSSLPLINIPTNIAKARLDDAIQNARANRRKGSTRGRCRPKSIPTRSAAA